MNQFKVLVEADINGTLRSVNDIVELSEEAAAPLISEGKIEAVPAATTDTTNTTNAPAADAADTTAAPANDGGASVAKAPRLVTEEDLGANPILVELNAVVGDTVILSK